MLRLLLIPAALVVLLSAAMLWSGGGAESRADFTFINRGEITTLDPNRMSWMQDIRAGYALWEGLYMLDPQTLEPVPGAADRIDVNPDKTVYTFHVRDAARWSNGDKVTSGDFVFAWRRMLELPGDYTYLLTQYIKGAKEFEEAFAKDKAKADWASVGIEAPDAATLRVTLKHPLTIFPDLCAFPPYFPLHEPSMRFAGQRGGDGQVVYDQKFTRPPHLVTNGPYRLHEWAFKRKVRLVKNQHYWDRARVKSETIDMISAEDPMAQFLIYESGGVDWLTEVSAEIASDLRKQGRKDLKVFPAFGTYFYSFNCQPTLPGGVKNPFADVRVRQAFTMALDKQPIVDNVTRMGEQITTVYIPRGVFPGYQSPPGLPIDRERARRLLAEAGYPGGRGFPRIALLFNTGASHGDIAQIVRNQWLNELGVNVSLSGVEIKIFREQLHNKEYAVARASWYGDYNDPSTFTDKYLTGGQNNDSGWSNAEYDGICAQAAVEPDAKRRLELFSRAEEILTREVPILPMYHYVNTYLAKDYVRGLPTNVRNMVNFKSVEVVR